jgi:hypothetical protein
MQRQMSEASESSTGVTMASRESSAAPQSCGQADRDAVHRQPGYDARFEQREMAEPAWLQRGGRQGSALTSCHGS